MCKPGYRRWPCGLIIGLVLLGPARAEDKPAAVKLPEKLQLSALAPAKLFPGLCVLRYRVSTTSPECQQFVDQALGYQYSYVWMEAARSFETATAYDPNCAFAWWGLSRALEAKSESEGTNFVRRELDRAGHVTALKKAHSLLNYASYNEQQLITARMQEKGLLPDVGDENNRRNLARRTLDDLLAVHSDDEEAWFYRGQLAADGRLFGGNSASVPFYKALLQLNLLHPGANHEFVHFYEGFTRPALGWVYSENYIKSSPGIPHSWHMQSHLATRLGRWDKATGDSLKAAELQRAYHVAVGVAPKEDHQFSHHLEILTLCLTHDGRFREARALKAECEGYGYKHPQTWFRLCFAERDFAAALKIADDFRRRDKATSAYLAALVYLAQNQAERAQAEVEVLEEAFQTKREDRGLQFRLWETRGVLLCQAGSPDVGLALLQKVTKATMNDYGHHAWGNGAYYMEAWGLAALAAGKSEAAEEAFLEALAHDSGSVRAALGLQTLCERQGRTGEAQRYATMAQRYWKHADVATFVAEQKAIRGSVAATATFAAGGN